jgi:23S rRNA G2445 N2-methylase RlmL
VGTIPLEAAAVGGGLRIVGSDQDRRAIEAAVANGAGASVRWMTADAGLLPLARCTVDLVVTNPPWDRQVPTAGLLAGHPQRLWQELGRVLRADGRAVVLLTDGDDRLMDAEKAGLTTIDRRQVSLFGAHPEIVVLQPS